MSDVSPSDDTNKNADVTNAPVTPSPSTVPAPEPLQIPVDKPPIYEPPAINPIVAPPPEAS